MLILLALFSIALILLAGCERPKTTIPNKITQSAKIPPAFVGSEACAYCHKQEMRDHQVSGHALTLRPVDFTHPSNSDPPEGVIPQTALQIKKAESNFIVRNSETHKYFPLTLAFGSGKQGVTYAHILDDSTLFEMRYSYFSTAKKWYVTPGHEGNLADKLALGMETKGAIPRVCIQCHAVTLPEKSVEIEPKFMGVGCESCHGPGSAHIVAVNTPNATDLKMAKLGDLGGAKLNDLCGKCHRTVAEVQKLPASNQITQRFFPYGLSKSLCFIKSDDKMTCITCHDAHKDVSKNLKFYETRCLSCHTKNDTGVSNSNHPTLAQTICKINPKFGCIGCHMANRNSFPGTSLPIKMADHWIRIDSQLEKKSFH